MEEIVTISIDELHTHPNQIDIYGQEKPDADFVQSIKDKGVLTPLVITPKENGGYTIISGHRRRHAAEMSGLKYVPCLIRLYKNKQEMDLAHIEMNRQREKNIRQKINEFIAWKQILRQDLQLIDTEGLTIDKKTAETILVRRRAEYKIKEENQPKRIRDIIREKTGLTQWFQRNATIIFDDVYLGDWFDKMRQASAGKDIEKSIIKTVYDFVKHIRENVINDSLGLSEGAKAIKELQNKYEDKLKPKTKRKKKTKTKIRTEPKEKLYSLIRGLNYTYSQTPMKFNKENSSIDYVVKTEKGNDLGLIKTTGSVTGICIHIKSKDETYMINLDKLAKIIERSV